MAAAVNFGDQLVDGHTRFKKLSSIKLSLHSPGQVSAVAISQDGSLMASADDGGGLEIRLYDKRRHHWLLVRKYTRGGQIRTLHWWRSSLSASWSLFLGSSFGIVWRIMLNFVEDDPLAKNLDVLSRAKVDGYVHCLSVSTEGKLIVASGNTVKLYDRPFHTANDLGPSLLFQDVVPITTADERNTFEAQYDIRWVPRVRKFHFLEEDLVLLSFFGRIGIHIFSTANGMQQASIPLRPGHIIGSSALSPGGDILAVTNLCDGVDWYSVSLKRYLTTSTFDVAPAPVRNIIVDLVFIDQSSVAVGHSRGDFIVVSFGFPNPIRHEESHQSTDDFFCAVTNVALGVTESKHLIVRAAVSSTGKTSRRFVLQVRQIVASKDRMRRLALLASDRSNRKDPEGQVHPERQTNWDAIKNYPVSLALVSIWGAANILIYTGGILQASIPSLSVDPTATLTETAYSTTTITMISMAQATKTTTSVSTTTNWQTVTMTPPPVSSACFCTVMLSGVLQQAQTAEETALSAGDPPSYIDQSKSSLD